MDQKLGVKIIGTGSYLPPEILTNNDLEKMVDTSNDWIVTRTGIHERRITDENTSTADIATKAAQEALKKANIDPKELDVIIVATVTADYTFPSTACLIQNEIGAVNAAAFDISAACSGFLYALTIGVSLLHRNSLNKIMVIGAETLSKITDWEDRATCVLFGDGAGCMIIEGSEGGALILDQNLGADGTGWDLLTVPAGGSKKITSIDTVKNKEHYIKMKGNELYKWAVNKMKCLIADAVERVGISYDDVKYIIPHQVNIRIIDAALKRLKFPSDKVVIHLDKYGNTSAASIPIAIDELNRSGQLKKGDIIILVAFGSGLTWASTTIKW